MTQAFKQSLMAGWADMDFNGHLRNTAYLDRSADVRLTFFAHSGFSMSDFVALGFGPLAMRDELEYFKEIRLLEHFEVHLFMAGLSTDGSRYILQNEFFRDDGVLAARVKTLGSWLHLTQRKLVGPPGALVEVLQTLPRAPEFTVLPSLLKKS